MKHIHLWLLSRALVFAISTTTCHASDNDTDAAHSSSYASTVKNSLGNSLFNFFDNVFNLIKNSSQHYARDMFHQKVNGSFHGLNLHLMEFTKKRRHMNYTHWARQNPDFKPHYMRFETLPSGMAINPSVSSVNIAVNEPSTNDLLDAIKKSTKPNSVLSSWMEDNYDPESFTYRPRIDLDERQIENCQISTLKEEHKTEISLLKRAHAERELAMAQELYALKEQLNAVLQSQFSFPTDFDPDEYLSLHPHIKEYAEKSSMTLEESRLFAETHYRTQGGPHENLPYKKDQQAVEKSRITTPTSRLSVNIIDTMPEDIRNIILENVSLIIEADKHNYDLETYTRLYMHSLPTDK